MNLLKTLAVTSALILHVAASQAAAVASNPWSAAATDAGAHSQANQQLATQFALGAGANINRATWHGTMARPDPLNTGDLWGFSVNIYADTGSGTPGALLDTANVLAGVTDSGIDVEFQRDYLFDASFASISVGSGTYWLSILNTGTPGTFRWTKGTTGLASALDFLNRGWGGYNDFARTPPNFTLFDDGTQHVPEPATLALVGAALAALALRRRA